jgi:hypothetical protein
MESNKGRIGQFFSGLAERITEQAWYQQAKAKWWDDLDPQSRGYLQKAFWIGGALLIASVVIGSIWSVRSLKAELNEKTELLTQIQSASEELRRTRDAGGGGMDTDSGPVSGYLESQAQGAGIDRGAVAVGEERSASPGGGKKDDPGTKESFVDVTLKKVNIKQVVRYAHALENGSRPIKVRSLSIDTEPDLSGYMNATLALSAFKTGNP